MKNDDEEIEAYLRKHTLNGQMRELRDAWMTLWRLILHEVARVGFRILDMLGM